MQGLGLTKKMPTSLDTVRNRILKGNTLFEKAFAQGHI